MNVTLTQPVAQYGDKGDTVDVSDSIAAHWTAIGIAKTATRKRATKNDADSSTDDG